MMALERRLAKGRRMGRLQQYFLHAKLVVGGHISSCSWYSSPNYRQGLPLPSCCSNTFNFPSSVPARHLWQVRETSVLL